MTPEAGAFACFEGVVRNTSDGKSALRLEYEIFDSLAIKEGNVILTEAKTKFSVISAKCVHRTGTLAIGETAVWVGVVAGHRDEAFKACRYIIDEIKSRVPIFKKEYYANGDSDWVGIPEQSEQTVGQDEKEYYSRQFPLAAKTFLFLISQPIKILKYSQILLKQWTKNKFLSSKSTQNFSS